MIQPRTARPSQPSWKEVIDEVGGEVFFDEAVLIGEAADEGGKRVLSF